MDKKKIIIVDDEADILRLTLLRLEKYGFDVITAVNGVDAIDKIQKEMPDVVLLDMAMPLLTGDEVCRRLKNNKELKHIPIILFTASSNTMTEMRARLLGADDFIVKPFDPNALISKIEGVLTCKVLQERTVAV